MSEAETTALGHNALVGILSGDERGVTLVELLVVVAVLGGLAALALPAFTNQKSKGTDADAKSVAIEAAKAMEACGSSNQGYAACSKEALLSMEPSLRDAGERLAITPGRSDYRIVVGSKRGSDVAFTLSRSASGGTSRTCSTSSEDRGGCVTPSTGTW